MIENTPNSQKSISGQLVSVEAGAINVRGLLHIPSQAQGIVILAHGVDAVEILTHNSALTIAQTLFQHALATLVVDLFTTEEQQLDAASSYFRANTDIMQQRIIGIAQWLSENSLTHTFSIGYFGMGTTGAAALIAAAERPDLVAAIVSSQTQLSAAQDYLPRILAPTLLIVAESDQDTITTHQDALAHISAEKRFEQGVQQPSDIARLACTWFSAHLSLVAE